MSNALSRLAELAGIEPGWWDFYGCWREVPDSTRRAFLAAMGLPAATEKQAEASLRRLEEKPWRQVLEPVLVAQSGEAPPAIAITLPARQGRDAFEWVLTEELKITHRGGFRPDDLPCVAERTLGKTAMRRWLLHLPAMPAIGYHRLALHGKGGKLVAEMTIAVAPAQAYSQSCLDEGRGAWGVAAQIYSLRDASDWGLGTYGSLGRLAAGLGALGADSLGVNPLHALFPYQPDRFSPYSPSSRRFLNIAYLDVEGLPEFAASLEARRMFASPGFQASLSRVRGYPLVEYMDALQLARPMLEALFRTFRRDFEAEARGNAFRAFLAADDGAVERFALFEVLHEHFTRQGTPYWRQWPKPFQQPDSPEVAAFAAQNRERVAFHAWLQFIADEQLAAAHAAGLRAGMRIGLYRDLGVGIAGDGAEAWMEQGRLALDVAVGAPPDPLAPKGQNWGLVPFNPLALRDAAYGPFIEVLRTNMRHAGAMRLDHAMGLARLYWVPPHTPADQGAYVRYPAQDMFRLLALESRRARCLVVGEDLGTVPDGFRPAMEAHNIQAYRVMVFEKNAEGGFKTPQAYDRRALAVACTHDLPTLRGWWAGGDIVQRARLELFPTPDMAAAETEARAADRAGLVAALAAEGLLEADFPLTPDLDDAQAERLILAAHRFLACSRARLMMVQAEDVLALDLQMNLPGTTTEHPNWRRRLPLEVAALLADPRLAASAEILGAHRRQAS